MSDKLKVLLNENQQVVGQTKKEGLALAKELTHQSGGNTATIARDGWGSSSGPKGTITAIPKKELAEEFRKANGDIPL